MTRDHANQEIPNADWSEEVGVQVVIAGTTVYTPAQLVTAMSTDTLRIGVPIMRPGFITMTGLLPSSIGSRSQMWPFLV
jgi:hypothetical protein